MTGDRPGRMLDYAGASEITGLCRGTLASLVHRRAVPHVRIGPRLVRFDRGELEAWLDARRVPLGGGR